MSPVENKTAKGKVCVTGAAGFIGSYVVKKLLDSGYEVEGVVRDPGDYKKIGHLWELDGAKERLHLSRGELMEEGSFDKPIMGCEGVFHLAYPIIFPKNDPKAEVLDPVVQGTLNVLRSCAKNPNLKKVVYTSSIASVAWVATPPTGPLDENTWSSAELCEQRKLWYPLGKILTEKAAWEFAEEKNIKLISIVPSYCLGPCLPKALHETAADFYSLLKGEERYGRRGRQGYIHIDDLATIQLLAYEDDSAEGRYLCTSSVHEVQDLAAIIKQRYPELPIRTSFSNCPQRPRFEYNTSKVQKLGIKFKGIEEMIDDTVESLKEQGHLP